MIGSTVGHYTIIEELGRGGMAVVYRAHDQSLNREVAFKVLPREFLHDATFRERFTREAQTIAGLEHPAIVPIYDFGEDDGQPFFVMRYMLGGSLIDRIASGLLPLEDVSKFIDRIGSALDAAHARGIIHRDVKPSNILFDNYDEAYLSDFGIVRLAEATAHLTGGGIVGTPAYMAPELAGKGGLTPSADIYALGITLFQILTGFQPFEADTPMGLIMAHISRSIPDIRDVRPDLPENLQRVIERGMAKDPAERYQSAGELAEGLRQVLKGMTSSANLSASPVAPAAEAHLPLETQPVVEHTFLELTADPTIPEVIPVTVAPGVTRPTRKKRPWLWVGVGGGIGLIILASVIIAIAVLASAFAQPKEPEESIVVDQETSTATVTASASPEPSDTPTSTVTVTSTLSAFDIALSGNITRNAEWLPYIETINGVEMALVPAGCFQMGSSADEIDYAMRLCEAAFGSGQCDRAWFDNETPKHQVCFDESFWIDVYEVTNEQYGSIGCVEYSSEPDHPRNCVSWVGAQEHCESRGARLPTEAEWEYAARGVDGLIFPWGNTFDGTLVNYCDVNCPYDWADRNIDDGYQSNAPVGSYPGGVSWVGVYDMSGNAWEWVSSLDLDYPYDPGDGRESGNSSSTNYHVLRGGSWDNNQSYLLRAAYRTSRNSDFTSYTVGFRCALTYNPEG